MVIPRAILFRSWDVVLALIVNLLIAGGVFWNSAASYATLREQTEETRRQVQELRSDYVRKDQLEQIEKRLDKVDRKLDEIRDRLPPIKH